MLNVFYCYGIVWSIILILYSFGWSDLCSSLNGWLLFILIVFIIVSFGIGYYFKDKIKFSIPKLKKVNVKNVSKIFMVFFLFEFIIEWNIPLLNVLLGNAYNSVGFSGIPILHMVMTSLAIIYSFYLSYIFTLTKDKKMLLHLGLILLYFLLLMQRQNILICILIFINLFSVSIFENFKIKKIELKKKCFVGGALLLSVALLLYLFGVFGNVRYGSNWKWNDSSMMMKLGRINDKYPSLLPEEYSWSYVYLVSPLVNLNENIKNKSEDSSIKVGKYILEFIPEFIANKFNGYSKDKIYLPVKSLTASTSYVRAYNYTGFLGMVIMFIAQMGISIFVLLNTKKNNSSLVVVNCMCVLYFLIFSFFENTFVYSVTSMVLLFALIMSFDLKKIRLELLKRWK